MKTIRYRSRTAETRKNTHDAQIEIAMSVTSRSSCISINTETNAKKEEMLNKEDSIRPFR
ncbi:hypothetical protein DPMN_193985 [Dreissena polymorpha]|uniref:Uncharacterized protein n=1 Tax=Dreissena polymorpha TaxID=45954 RepID=A0A9D3Y5K7_DREPO|nr:hypothetical protein DPMN_193985 [Dreissena polymorpha]